MLMQCFLIINYQFHIKKEKNILKKITNNKIIFSYKKMKIALIPYDLVITKNFLKMKWTLCLTNFVLANETIEYAGATLLMQYV